MVGLLVCGASGSGAMQVALHHVASGIGQAADVQEQTLSLQCQESCMPPLQTGLLHVKPGD